MWSPDSNAYTYDLEKEIHEPYATMIITHEYAHQLNDLIEKGSLFSNFGIFPVERDLWFVEGLAEYISNGYEEFSYDSIVDAVDYDYLLSWEEMRGMNVWGFDEYEIHLIYAEGYTVFKFLEVTYGDTKLKEFFQTIQNGQSPDQALEQVYGKSKSALEAEWRTWLLNNYRSLEFRDFSDDDASYV